MDGNEVDFFNRIAPVWDSMEVKSTSEKVREILDIVKIATGSKVLDLGTGTGVLLPFLSARVGENGMVVGVDFSEGMLDVARGKVGRLRNVELMCRDFESEDIDGRFDVIMMYCVYPHLHRPVETLNKLKDRNLNTRGRIIIGFPSDEHFINAIHGERKVESDMLPAARDLADRFDAVGFCARVLAYSPDIYLVEIR